jgi:hypothetical protein
MICEAQGCFNRANEESLSGLHLRPNSECSYLV